MLNADPLLYWNSRTYSDTDHSTDELDGFVEKLLQEVNAKIGTASPRYTVTSEALQWSGENVNELGKKGRLSEGRGIIATGLRHGTEVTYRVAVERITNNPDQWPAAQVRVLRDGVDTGERVVVRPRETGTYYTVPFVEGVDYTFDFEPVPTPNMLASLNLSGGMWKRGEEVFTSATSAVTCPVDGVPVTSLYDKGMFGITGPPVEVVPGQVYTFSAYLLGRSSSGRGGVSVADVEGNRLASFAPYNREDAGWGRFSVTFRATTNVVYPQVSAYRQYACAPALHEGGTAGRVEPGVIFTQEKAEQRIQLQQGLNLISLNVDPGDISPDSLLREHPGVALVRDVNGDAYSARFDIREIRTWDARTAYRVLADEPAEIVLKGRPLHMDGIEVQEGWNLVPFVYTEPLSIETVAAAYPGILVRVEDDRGNVYEPGDEASTLRTFEPGRAYRVYAAQAAYLSFSP